jgi:hypothetical protein
MFFFWLLTVCWVVRLRLEWERAYPEEIKGLSLGFNPRIIDITSPPWKGGRQSVTDLFLILRVTIQPPAASGTDNSFIDTRG